MGLRKPHGNINEQREDEEQRDGERWLGIGVGREKVKSLIKSKPMMEIGYDSINGQHRAIRLLFSVSKKSHFSTITCIGLVMGNVVP